MRDIIRILRSAGQLKKYYFLISVLTILLSLLTLLQPLLSGWAIDEIRLGSEADVQYVAILAALIFVLDLSQTIFSNIGGYFGDQMSTRLQKILSSRYYEHLLNMPQRYFDTELSGKIISRLSRSILQITNFMQMLSNNFLQFIFTTVFSLIVVAYYSPVVALMLLSLYPIYIWMTFRSSDRWQKFQKRKNAHTDIASGRFAEAINQIKAVKSYLQERRELKFFDSHMQSVVNTNKPQSKHWHTRDVQRRLALNIIFLGVYMYIFIRGAQGSLTPGQVVTLILYAMQIRIPIFTISFLVESTQKAVADSRDYFEIMNLKQETIDTAYAKPIQVTDGRIEFENVSFGYNDKSIALRNISFSLKPGTKTALVGESGEGKTTLMNLLLRFYDPMSGIIYIDGQNIKNITHKSLRENIGIVFQEPYLFSGTIRENISYANPNATLRQIKKAASAANAHEFISKFDKGYETEIGERGLKLSGGQKQRIAIARAILKDAPVLILDEATSSLDSKSERMVQEALEQLMNGRTTIIIAHRFSTIQNVDQIVTIKNGQIDEIGTPKELAKSGGIYDTLLRLQTGKLKNAERKLQQYEISA